MVDRCLVRRSLLILIAVFFMMSQMSVFAADSSDYDADSDPLISKKYLLETFTADFFAKVRALLESVVSPVGESRNVLAEERTMSNGMIFVKTGSSFVVDADGATLRVVFGAVIDATDGVEVAFGSEGEAEPEIGTGLEGEAEPEIGTGLEGEVEAVNGLGLEGGTEPEIGYGLKAGKLYIAAENTLAIVEIPETASVAADGDFAAPSFDSAVFVDVGVGHWAFNAVQSMAALSLVNGRGVDVFDPNAHMTRGEFVTVLGRLYGLNTSAYRYSEFADVVEGEFFTPYVNWAASEGIVGGYGDGSFGPYDSITRAQMAVLIVRFAEKMGIELSNGDSADSAESNFVDSDSIPEWSKTQVYIAQKSGLISGRENGAFDPGGNSSRSEVCAVIYRLITMVR